MHLNSTSNSALVSWTVTGVRVPSFRIDETRRGMFVETVRSLFQVSAPTLYNTERRHPYDFSGIRLGDCIVTSCKDIFESPEIRDFFGISRAPKDRRVYTQNDVIAFSYHIRTPQSVAIRKEVQAAYIRSTVEEAVRSGAEFVALQRQLDETQRALSEVSGQRDDLQLQVQALQDNVAELYAAREEDRRYIETRFDEFRSELGREAGRSLNLFRKFPKKKE